MTFDEWLTIGIDSGFCSEPDCETHNAIAMTIEEAAEFEEGGDPCIPAVRLWLDEADEARRLAQALREILEAPGVGGPHIVPQEPERE